MRCASCDMDFGDHYNGPIETAGDCHPLCPDCRGTLGKRVRPTRHSLLKSLYSAGRDLSICQCCGAGGELEIHFLLPLVRGGGEDSGNLLLLCRACHEKVHQGARIFVSPRRTSDQATSRERPDERNCGH